MKRLTVNRMLRQRLAESKRSISSSYQYEDLVNVLGGDNSKEIQHKQNTKQSAQPCAGLAADSRN